MESRYDERVVLRNVDDREAAGLRRLNLGAAALHLFSGALMIVLGNDFSLPITLFNLNGPPGSAIDQGAVEQLGDVPVAPLTAAFMFLSAVFHLMVAVTPARDRYLDELSHRRNRFRWAEYTISSTLMIVLIALLVSISDVTALIGIGFANVSMILFGWVMEMVNPLDDERPAWFTPFWFGCVAGLAPWLGVVAYLTLRGGDQDPPGFVYGIIVSLFLAFNCFAVVQFLQYRKVGKFSDYLVGERAYIALSFIAKSLLGWQVFANVLVD